MDTLESVKRRIDSARQLRTVIATMKVLATVNIRQYERAVEAFLQYMIAIEQGMQILLQEKPAGVELTRPPADNRLLALVFGSGQGLAGKFNEQIASYAMRQMAEMGIKPPDRTVLALGEHVATRLAGSGQHVEEYFTIPGSLPGVNSLAQQVVIRIEELRRERAFEQIILFFHRPLPGASYRPYRLPLLPINPAWLDHLAARPWPGPSIPTFTGDWETLFEALIRQDLYVSLNRAFVESLTSENASRLASMQAAENNIDDRLDELTHQFNHQRQESITGELLDIVAGFEALESTGV